jgi:beta-lactamase class A
MSQVSSERPLSGGNLTKIIQQIEADSGGSVFVAACDLDSGDSVTYNADERVKTASVIKLPMLAYVAQKAFEGEISWEEKLVLTDTEKVGGSGVLTQLTEGLVMSVRDICTLMTIVSDNTGTNMIIDRFGVAPMNAWFDSIGLTGTRIFRKSFTEDTEASRSFGLGSTTANDIITLLQKISAGEIGDRTTSDIVLKMLQAQVYRDCIPRYLPEDWTYAGKTGAVDGVRNDAGLVTTPDGRRFALAVFTQGLQDLRWTSDNTGLVTCARLAKALLLPT